MTAVQVDIAAVVVTYNSERHISASPRQHSCRRMGDLTYSVVVVDNGSIDGTLELLETRTDCVVVRSRNDGYAAGMNRAVAASPDARRPILILNPDATLDPGRCRRWWRFWSDHGVRHRRAARARGWTDRLSPTLRRGPTMGRVGGLSFTGWPVFTERIEDPQRVRDRARGRMGRRRHPARSTPLAIDALRWHGRVLLPLLRGDRLQPAGEGHRLG